MRTTKTTVETCYSQKEVECIMTREGLTPSPFPVLPVCIELAGGKTMRIREASAVGMDDEGQPGDRLFVVRMDGVPLE
jgi:hypothetical protein